MLDFQAQDILGQLNNLNHAEFDELSFGVVRMEHDGTVNAYNRAEAQLSGMSAEQVIGKNFFVQIAPCTNNYLVAQRFQDETEMDETIDYVFTLKMRPTRVSLRMLKSGHSKNQYLLVAKRS